MAGPHRGMFLALRLAHLDTVGKHPGPQAGADMHVEGQRGGAAIAPDLGRRQHVGAKVGAAPAMFARDADSQQVAGAKILVVFGRKAGLPVDFGGTGGKFRLRQGPRLGAERRLEFGQPPAVRIEDRAVLRLGVGP